MVYQSRPAQPNLAKELKPFEILFGPTSLPLNHRLKSFDGECIALSMRRHGYAPSIGMAESLMRSGLADERKTIALKGADQLSGGQ